MKRAFKMIVAGLAIATPLAVWSQSENMGPGMMGGHGHSMMGNQGGGMMGKGMMGGSGSGMMGPGMMGGSGSGMMGPGMMGNCGSGHYGQGGGVPDLTADQQTKIQAIQKEFRAKEWALMGKMRELDLPSGMMGSGPEAFDETAARKAYDEMAALRKQMFENRLDVHKQIDAVLTEKQREQRGR